ncbi:recombinase family protein [Pendulispora brunnea]|uniref:recombinase family protein n=1 Tax=Pendulispora brunnea TaxID=2905690 RepID=UPI00374E1290
MPDRKEEPVAPKVAVAYLRTSTARQDLGLAVQRVEVERWASRAGVNIVAVHVDCGVSGAAGLDARAGLAEALASVRAQSARYLVVATHDRFARGVATYSALEKCVRRAGARVVSADDVANDESPSEQFIRTVLSATAEYERAVIAQRTKAALAVRKARGLRVGSIPLGYQLAPDGRSLVRSERELSIAVEARRFREGGLSLRAIGDALSAMGHAPRSGRLWHPEIVRSLLRAGLPDSAIADGAQRPVGEHTPSSSHGMTSASP